MIINLLYRLISIYSLILVIYAIMSWIPGLRDSKLGEVIADLSMPYLNLFKNLDLTFGNFDFTVWVAVFSLQILQRLLIFLF
ncbi:YggT family protein [Streptococcaceae bacterium ESL0729]|nr:YggT family protein [Streptococcaceae bacterium ESL0729]